MNDDAALVQRCLEGDEAGMRALVERYQGIVFGVCYRMLGQREDAEDVAQDVFLRVFRSLHRWDAERPLKPWLLTIAANRCRTALERRSRQPVPSEAADRRVCEDGRSRGSELAEELQLALATLRDDYRMCFVLFYEQELSCSRIGEILGCPEGTVKTWLHRARKELAEFLTRRGVTPAAHVASQQAAG
ncbi:MAG TPA: RNA polymerase sigma factor [Planctomycetaceae bacterium]|nr:RNA polymerase sigma factor [Planctomycetaceae bacterium]